MQIDYVNVLVPAHYQVPYSRLGPYEKSQLDNLVYHRREFTEQWAHEASIVPVESWPLLRHRMESHRVRPWGFESFLEQNTEYVAWVLDEVRTRGPIAADDVPEREGVARRLPGTWVGTVPRAVLEVHFARGILAVAQRRTDFSRTFDLTERLIPGEHHGRQIGREEAQRELLRLAARAHGVGTADDLADYYRMKVPEARPRLAELVESGELHVVRVEGWRQPAYLHREARLPKQIEAATLLSPFDPVIWHRAGRPAVRVRIPRRDFRARPETAVGILRAPVSARRPARGSRGPESRPKGVSPVGSGGAHRESCRARRGRIGSRRRTHDDGAVVGPRIGRRGQAR